MTALKGRNLVAGGNAPGKLSVCEADPERVNGFQAGRNKWQSTPSGSVTRAGRFPGTLPPAIESIPFGDLSRCFSEAETSFSAACEAPPFHESIELRVSVRRSTGRSACLARKCVCKGSVRLRNFLPLNPKFRSVLLILTGILKMARHRPRPHAFAPGRWSAGCAALPSPGWFAAKMAPATS